MSVCVVNRKPMALSLRTASEDQKTPAVHPGWVCVRGWAAVGVVILHSCIAYSSVSMPGLAWPIRDSVPGGWQISGITALMWAIEVIIMPIFLVLAGHFAMVTLNHKGGWATIRSRMRRLGWPLIMGVCVILPIDLYVWLVGWLSEGTITMRELRALKFHDNIDANLWGLSHLWFLPYLMTYVVGLGLLDLWACRHEKRLSNWLRCNTWSISAIWLTSVGLIAIAPQIVWGFQHAFLPVPTKWAYCGLFFLLGAMLQSTNGMWNDISAVASRMFPIAIMMLLATVAMGQHATDLVGMDVDADSQRNGTWSLSVMPMTAIVLALMTPTTAALTTVVVLGWTNRAIRQPGRISASLSAASLTIYLAHHPVVAATQIMLKTAVPMWPPLVKVTLVVVTGVGLPWLMHVMHAARAARRDDDVGQAPRTITLPKPDIAKAA